MTMSLTTKGVVGRNAEQIFGRLQGLLCLYKEKGSLIGTGDRGPLSGMKKNFAQRMAEDINTKEQRPIRQLVKIHEENVGTDLPVVTTVPDLSDHPLVVGPRFESLKMRETSCDVPDVRLFGIKTMLHSSENSKYYLIIETNAFKI